uniref:Putative capsid protein n=1 Tax=viral metagenome TaxID=1070528 RepID=A0A6M3M486_9ZZZZ
MPEPTGSDLHIDTFLSNLSIGFLNLPSAYIADLVFPVVHTAKQSDKYAIYNKYDWFRDEAQLRAPLAETAGGGWGLETPGTFFCNEWGYHSDVADEDIDNADEVFHMEEDATAYVIEKLRLSRERRWATNYFGIDIWDKDLEGQTDTPGTDEFLVWDDASSTPIEDIEDAKAIIKGVTGLMPNTFVVAERVHQTLKNHLDVVDRFKYTQAGIITEQLLARVFGIDRYMVAGAVYALSPEGSETMAYALTQYDALLVYSAPRPNRRHPSGGYTFRWNRPILRGMSGDRLEATIRKFRLEKQRGTRIEGGVFEDQKLVATECGVYFHNCIAAGRTITS